VRRVVALLVEGHLVGPQTDRFMARFDKERQGSITRQRFHSVLAAECATLRLNW
jgi:hypothetical protein